MTLPSQRLRQRPSTSRAGWGALLSALSRSRLFEAAKPWLIVALFLLVLGLAGGVETGAVWP